MFALTVLLPYVYGMGLYLAWAGTLENPGFGTVLGWQFWLAGVVGYWWDRRSFTGQLQSLRLRIATGRREPTVYQKYPKEIYGTQRTNHSPHEDDMYMYWVKELSELGKTTLQHGLTVLVLRLALFSSGSVQRPNATWPSLSLLVLALAVLGTPLDSGMPRSLFALVWLKDRVWLRWAAHSPMLLHARFGVLCVVLGVLPLVIGRTVFPSDSDLVRWTAGLAVTLPFLGTILVKYPPPELRQHALMKTPSDLTVRQNAFSAYKLAGAVVGLYTEKSGERLSWAMPNFLLQLVLLAWPADRAALPVGCFLAVNYYSDMFWFLAMISGHWSGSSLKFDPFEDIQTTLVDIASGYIAYPGSLVDYRDLPESLRR